MLSSLRALGPKVWTTAPEVAWSWLGELVECPGMESLAVHRRGNALTGTFLTILDEETGFRLRKELLLGSCQNARRSGLHQTIHTYLQLVSTKCSRWCWTCIGIQVVGQQHLVGWPTPCRLRHSSWIYLPVLFRNRRGDSRRFVGGVVHRRFRAVARPIGKDKCANDGGRSCRV